MSSYSGEPRPATGADRRSVSTIIPNGVELPAAPPDGKRPPVGRPPHVSDRHCTRMQERYKGHDVLVRALTFVRTEVPDVAVGGHRGWDASPGEIEALRPLLRGAFDPSLAQSRRAAQRMAARTQLIAMPSRLPAGGFAGEGFGIVYLEAERVRQAGGRRRRRRRARRGPRRTSPGCSSTRSTR